MWDLLPFTGLFPKACTVPAPDRTEQPRFPAGLPAVRRTISRSVAFPFLHPFQHPKPSDRGQRRLLHRLPRFPPCIG